MRGASSSNPAYCRFSSSIVRSPQAIQTTTVSGTPPLQEQPCIVVVTMDRRQNSRVGMVADHAHTLAPPGSSCLTIRIGADLDEATRVLQQHVPADANVVLITDASPEEDERVRAALTTHYILDDVRGEHLQSVDFNTSPLPGLFALSWSAFAPEEKESTSNETWLGDSPPLPPEIDIHSPHTLPGAANERPPAQTGQARQLRALPPAGLHIPTLRNLVCSQAIQPGVQ